MLRKELQVGTLYWCPISTKTVLVWKKENTEDEENPNFVVSFRYYNDTTGKYEDHTALDNQLQSIPTQAK